MAVLALAAAGFPGYAQKDAGELRVVVEDASGASIASASVHVTNAGTNAVTAQVTNAQGYATFVPILRGTYVVDISKEGFRTVQVRDVTIDVDQSRIERVILQVSAASTAIEVTSAVDTIQTEDASLGQVVGGMVIAELPLAGRRYTDLTLLAPGSTESTADPNLRGPGWLVVNGNSQVMNNFLLDGFDNNQNTHNVQGRSAQVAQPSPDALSEFKLQTDNYSAEYGRAMGAVINASIKSGTNQLHGSAWWYNRDSSLAANAWVNNWENLGKNNLKWNQEGGTLGGPIVRNKLFIFGDYENFRSSVTSAASSTVPTLGMRQGDYSSLTIALTDPLGGVFPGNKIPGNRFDPLALKVLTTVYPEPNFSGAGTTGSGGRPINNYVRQVATTDFSNKFDTRVDYNLGPKNRIFGRESWLRDVSSLQPTFPGIADTGAQSGGPQFAQSEAFGVSWTTVLSPTAVNEVRYGFNKTWANFSAATNGSSTTGTSFGFLGLPPSLDSVGGLPRMTVSNYGSLGVGNYRPQYHNPLLHQIGDNFSWVKGTHTIKAGIDYRYKKDIYVDLNNRTVSYNFDGNYTGDASADMLLGLTQGVSGETFFEAREAIQNYAAFVQDSWKATRSLTINFGLRYEYTTPYYGTGGSGGGNVNFDYVSKQLEEAPGLPLTLGAKTCANRYCQNPDYKDFGPRIGGAYQINQKLVLRSGFGIFYDGEDIHGTSQGALLIGPPNVYPISYTRQGSTGPTPQVFSAPLPSTFLNTSSIPSTSLTVESREPDQYSARVLQWNVALQYATTKTSSFELAYVGNTADHLESPFSPNIVPYGKDGSVTANLPFPQFLSFKALEDNAKAHYNALQAKFEKRFSGSWYSLTSYTYQSGFADTSYFGTGGGGTQYYDFSGPVPQPIYEPAFNEQLTRNRLSVTNIYKLPIGRGGHFLSQISKPLDMFIGGWQIQGILTAKSGMPVNVSLASSGVNPVTGKSYKFLTSSGGDQLRPNRLGDANTSVGPETNRFDFLDINAFSLQTINTPGDSARNVAWGPPAFNIDASLTKRFAIDDKRSIDFRFESFNTVNHVNFGNPASTYGSPNFGVITTTATGALGSSRQIQMALRFGF
ncbi:MAG: TonB-dependent receptor [Ignavibacteriota bacterium]